MSNSIPPPHFGNNDYYKKKYLKYKQKYFALKTLIGGTIPYFINFLTLPEILGEDKIDSMRILIEKIHTDMILPALKTKLNGILQKLGYDATVEAKYDAIKEYSNTLSEPKYIPTTKVFKDHKDGHNLKQAEKAEVAKRKLQKFRAIKEHFQKNT